MTFANLSNGWLKFATPFVLNLPRHIVDADVQFDSRSHNRPGPLDPLFELTFRVAVIRVFIEGSIGVVFTVRG
jgi:hypothetical protein